MIQEKKSITKNYMYNLIYQVLVLISPLITIPYIARVLGAENIGIYSYTLSITAYFILFGALGMSLYAQREIAYNQDNPPKYSLIFWEMVLLRIITMSISILIYYFTIIKYGTYQLYYKILTLLIGNLSLWLYLPKFLVRIDIRKINILRHLKQTISLFVPQVAVQVYTILDKTMVGTIVQEKAEVGYYDQSQKIIKIALSVVTSLGTVMLPRIANNYIKNEKEAVRVYMEKSFNLIFLLSFPMMFGVCCVTGMIIKDNLIATVLEVLIGIITYFACLIILKEEFIGEILDKLNIQRNFKITKNR